VGGRFIHRTTEEEFLELLQQFVFFHLGSDVSLRIESSSGGLEVSMKHERIRPFKMGFSSKEIASFTADPILFEERMLEHLTENRRDRV
jgi:hypothetical protein